MALFDFLKRKKTKEKKVHPIKSSEAGVLPKAKQFNQAEKPEKLGLEALEGPSFQKTPKKSKITKDFSFDIIKQPHISEKATALAEKNQYVFKLLINANKTEIKKAVEGIYGVDVLSVNIINIPKKKRRIGRTKGFRKGYTKAVVKIKEGQKIEIL